MADQSLKALYDKTLAHEKHAQDVLKALAAQEQHQQDALAYHQGVIGILLQLDHTLDPERAQQMAEAAQGNGVPGWVSATKATDRAADAYSGHTNMTGDGPAEPPAVEGDGTRLAGPTWKAEGWTLERRNKADNGQ